MRIFSSAIEAAGEVQRDLTEMGTTVVTKSFQDKKDEAGFVTKEIVGYSFMLTQLEKTWQRCFDLLEYPDPEACVRYVEDEVQNRLGVDVGDPTKHRHEVWDQFREKDGEYSYTYRERIVPQTSEVINLHISDRFSRQLVMPIYQHNIDRSRRGGKRRVPCTMHYQILDRGNEFYLIDNMRSCDLYTHFLIDMLVAYKFAQVLQVLLNPGEREIWPKLVMTFGSLHAFEKDLKQRGAF